jgi:serine protease Do
MEARNHSVTLSVPRAAKLVFAGALTVAALVGAGSRGPAAIVGAPALAASPAESAPGGSYADVVSRVSPAVVTVRSQRAVRARESQLPIDPFEEFFGRRAPRAPQAPSRRERSLGSGVVVTADGYILTNHHVIEGARQVEVELSDGRTLKATVVGSDAPSDLAVLKLEARGLKTLPLGDSDHVRVGDVALAVGNPLGVGQTVTLGIVSAKGRATGAGQGSFEDFIQTDAPINQGNSGGALINTKGELIGINSQILTPSGGNIGIGFAIPTNMARNVMDQLIQGGRVHRGMLGVTVQPVSSDLADSLGLAQVKGALVSAVTGGSPADRSGVRRGDVITAINGTVVKDSNGLRNQISQLKPGTTAQLTLVRGGQERTLSVKLTELPSVADNDRETPAVPGSEGGLGLSVRPADGGVEVTGVDPAGPAAEAGIQEGDVVEEVNGTAVKSASDLRSAVSRQQGKPALVLVRRGEQTLYVAVPTRAA